MGRIIITFILTSLFWIAIFHLGYFSEQQDSLRQKDTDSTTEEPKVTPTKTEPIATKTKQTSPSKPSQPKAAEPQNTSALDDVSNTPLIQAESKLKDIATSQPSLKEASSETFLLRDEIIGKWQPIEGAEYPLEITEYGTAIQTMLSTNIRYDYAINGNQMKIAYDDAEVKIIKEQGNTYLEIYKSSDFSGRYKRISQPKQINSTPVAESEYAETIIGKWQPITGQEYPIEFTKFDTAITTMHSINRRYDYLLKGKKLDIAYDSDASVNISEDSDFYYLEIYNTTDFSGRYKKSK